MHIVKPHWLTHGGEVKDYDVYSCHVSPDGVRLATAAGDGYVRIWSTDAVLNSLNPEYTKPKQLAAISNHSGTIHAVRFSHSNQYLASGADDKIVCVYALDPNPPSHVTFGSNEAPPVENWRLIRRLVGHDSDVQDIGWSYDSSILVSVGLDSKIVVWSGHTFEKLKSIVSHTSAVKGITFDPANKYFATASDDRTIKVFRFTSPSATASAHDQIGNFTIETTISGPFVASPLTTYFRRCSWSPDGSHIAAANAVNGPVSSIAIINRGNWDSEINLIGHEGPVEVTAFSPRLFYPRPLETLLDAHGNAPLPQITVIACAGQDKTLTIWNTSNSRPVLITHELASKAISDLAWSPDGETLYMTSLDGGIMAASFEPGELGFAAALQENEKTLTKFGAGRKAGIIEGPSALLLEENSKAGELREVQGRMGALMGDGTTEPRPTANGTSNGVSSVATTNGTAPEPKKAAPVPQQPQADPRVEKLKQRVTITKDGKKRVAPLLVSSSAGIESSLPQTQLVSGAAQGVRSDAPHQILDLSKPYDGFPKGGLAGLLVGNKRKFADLGDEDRRVERALQHAVRDGGAPIVLNSADGLLPPSMAGPPQPAGDLQVLRPAMINGALAVSQIRLAIPLVRTVILRTLDGGEPTPAEAANGANGANAASVESATVLEARNAVGASRTGRPQDRDPTRISCTKRGQPLWQDYLPKAVLQLTGNPNFWAAGCEDGSIYVWTPAGRRLLNAMVLEAQPVIIDCRGWWLMAITAVGQCYVWNIKTLSSPHPPVSIAPILDAAIHAQGPHLTQSPGIIWARLNSEGRIVVALSDGEGYCYSPTMYTWQRLTESWWAVGSQYWNTMDSSVGTVSSSGQPKAVKEDDDSVSYENLSAGIIPLLERTTTNQVLLRGRAFYLQRLVKALLTAEGFEGFEAGVSVAHLENRLAAAMTLGAKEEFRAYLVMYAKRIGAEGMKGKVEELLRTLLGRTFIDDHGATEDADMAGKGWETSENEICGWYRLDLLREIVLILGKHRDLQRTTVPYAQLLDITKDRFTDDSM